MERQQLPAPPINVRSTVLDGLLDQVAPADAVIDIVSARMALLADVVRSGRIIVPMDLQPFLQLQLGFHLGLAVHLVMFVVEHGGLDDEVESLHNRISLHSQYKTIRLFCTLKSGERGAVLDGFL